jgi:hypothetical protein
LSLGGKTITWYPDVYRKVTIIEEIGKGRSGSDIAYASAFAKGRLEKQLLGSGRPSEHHPCPPSGKSASVAELRRIFEALRPLFPEGIDEGLYIDA